MIYLAVCIESKLLIARRHTEPESGGMHLGRWRESIWGKSEKLFDAGIELRSSREQAIVAAARFGRNAVCDLALNEENERIKVRRVVK